MKNNQLKINIGCGLTTADGWINCDSSLNAQIHKFQYLKKFLSSLGLVSEVEWPDSVKYFSVDSRWPWGDCTVDVVYASHVFEHLFSDQCLHFLSETKRVLKNDGIIRIVVPDLYFHAKKYVDTFSISASYAESFLSVMHLRFQNEKSIIRKFISWIQGYPNLHKNMYDEPTLVKILNSHNFSDVESLTHGVSRRICDMASLERVGGGYEGSIYIEAVIKK